MIDLKLNSSADLKRKAKVFIGQVFFYQKVTKKMLALFIQFVDILMILLINIVKIKLSILKIQLKK